ncbi:MAG TPA: FAD-dependent oxidoreductase [Candidatus Nanopelagicales bacterium]|nr:FAD-dependent oxidoreductase [Candidatus Nanopelagicales bacterium]
MTVTSDAVVIGAGVMGSATALELARAGRSVTVVDKAGGPGFGSTSASSAIIRFTYSTLDGVILAWESYHRWLDWQHHLGLPNDEGLARFHRVGMLALDVPLMPLERIAPLLAQARVPFEVWDADEVERRVPGIDAGSHYPPKPVHSEEFLDDPAGRVGGVFTPDAGFIDDPRLAAANLADAAAAAGAGFIYRRTVTGLQRTGGAWEVSLDDGTALRSPVVVNAAGPWSGALNRMVGADADFTIGQRMLRQEVHLVRAPGSLGHDGVFPSVSDMDLGTYSRPAPGGYLLVGGTEPECDPMEWLDDPDSAAPGATSAAFEAQVLRAARRFPDLAIPLRPSGIAGVYDVSDDWIPIYDRTSLPGFYVAVGTSGNQFKNAPVVGEIMARIVEACERGHDHDAEPIQFDCRATGLRLDLATFSRKRERNPDSSGTVMG